MIRRQLKILLRNPVMLFWAAAFPIILAIFFQLALGNITGDIPVDTIPVAYLNEAQAIESFATFDKIIHGIETNNMKFFDVITVSSNEEALKRLQADEVVALIDVSDEAFPLTIKNESIRQSVVAQVVASYHQTNDTITTILAHNSTADVSAVIESLTTEQAFFEPNRLEDASYNTIYFYSLIGMTALYGHLFGVLVINQNEANQSVKGQRVQVSPVKKSTLIISGLVASLIVHFVSMLILLAFLMLVLNVNLGEPLWAILLLSFIGCIAGISLGIFIGSSNKGSVDTKTGIGISLTMLLSAFAGMMYADLKLIIAQKAPILALINPITQISDGLQALSFYESMDRYWQSIIALSLFSVFMIGLSIFFTRRKQYDSL